MTARKRKSKTQSQYSGIPLLPLREVIIFPNMIYPLLAGRPKTQKAVEEAMLKDRSVLLLAQRDIKTDEPKNGDFYQIGVLGKILQILKLPTGLSKVLVEGMERVEVISISEIDGLLSADLKPLPAVKEESSKIQAAFRKAQNLFKEYILLNSNLPDELLLALDNVDEPGRIADFIAAHLDILIEKRQRLLETFDTFDRLMLITEYLKTEIEILKIEQSIDEQVKGKINRAQRNFYLQEQMRVIKKELGEEAEDDFSDIRDYAKKIRRAKMPKEVRKKANEELDKLSHMPMLSPEASVLRNYLDWLTDIPWNKQTEDNLDIDLAQKFLDEDHYGLKKPKERILEYLAVMKLVGRIRGQIICFVGPPGVGKTSLGQSIAHALNRKFVRLSLGGMRDEAEIRGHRRTYIGSLPGRIIQQMKRASTINPVFLLDEVDKMASDFRGDPASALLEVLDPEQNHAFSDHYLEVDYDLSKVLFITTANLRYNIPAPLLDRMEVIDLPGYLGYDKFMIAKHYLLPKNFKEHGLEDRNVKFSEKAIYKKIEDYPREAGVREMERCIAKVCRRIARILVKTDKWSFTIGVNNIDKFLGPPRYIEKDIVEGERVGMANALAWTSDGGDILRIEVALMKGKGQLTLTGQLGDVMKESARAALSYIRSIADRFHLQENDFIKREVHIHIPEGGVPKDGPSAGIALTLAMLSAFTGKPVPATCGFTGEITLRGEVLPIGGLPEKLMAANRLGVKKIFLPRKNLKDLSEIPKQVTKPLELIPVGCFDEVMDEIWSK
ncbi:MAG: endopeptidase La [FCB group bacterium]|nr:endopeptidase La [FCB group bacterium]